jgi:hypothetical protein
MYKGSEAVGARMHAKPRQSRCSGEQGCQACHDTTAEPPPDLQREHTDIRQLWNAPDQVLARAAVLQKGVPPVS